MSERYSPNFFSTNKAKKPVEESDVAAHGTDFDIDVDLSGTGGVPWKTMAGEKRTITRGALETAERISQIILSGLEKRGWVKKAELNPEQTKTVQNVIEFYTPFLEKYGRDRAEFSIDESLKTIRGLNQFGIGGIDTLMGNKIYLDEKVLKEDSFAYIFAHEFAHFISARLFSANDNGDLAMEKIGMHKRFKRQPLLGKSQESYFGHTLLDEGVTDLFALKVLKNNGVAVKEEDKSKTYHPYREIVSGIAVEIGDGDFDKGFDFFIQAYLTGDDSQLIEAINTHYGTDGYQTFVSLLNKFSGLDGILNDLEKQAKRYLREATSLISSNMFAIENDRHYKRLKDWVNHI